MEMAYFRRYRKGYRRNRKLTKASIYANRSARSQSRQIAKLNSKVNYLTKQNRPEVLSKYWTYTRTFTNSSLASNYEIYTWNPWSGNGSGDTGSADPTGNFARCKGISIRLNVEYSDSWSGNVSQSENHQRTASYRFVILQNKSSSLTISSGNSLFDQIFNVSSTLTSGDDNTIKPLRSGLTTEYKVLYSKAFTISNQHPARIHTINIPASKCINFSAHTAPNGDIENANGVRGTVILAILTGGLHADADYNSQIVMTHCCKLVYTDA